MLDTIKSYLVSLGFRVDDKSFNDVTRSMDSVERQVGKFAGTSVTKFAMAGAAVTSFVSAAVFGIGKYLDALGKADIANEKLARQLWTTEQNAMSFNATLKAMGVSLEDLYLSPTLMSQFKQLRGEASGLQAPAEYKEQMRTIQSISFEFKRMKLEATYALQWIGYYLIKYLDGPLKGTKRTLSELNDSIVKNMPQWTKKVAQVMSWFVQMGATMVRGVGDVGRAFDKLSKLIPDNLKIIAAAAASIGLIIATGPFGILATSILAVFLLLEDFYGYLDGKESAFGPLWEKLIDFKDELDASGQLQALRDGFVGVFDAASDVLSILGDIVKSLIGENGVETALAKLGKHNFDLLIGGLQTIKSVLDGIKTALSEINTFIESVNSGTVDEYLADRGQKIVNYATDQFQNDKASLLDKAKDNLLGMSKTDWAKFFIRPMTGPFMPAWDANMLPDYVQRILGPQTTTNNSSKVEINQTNNVYGSDPQATAGVIDQNLSSFMRDYHLRGLQGAIR